MPLSHMQLKLIDHECALRLDRYLPTPTTKVHPLLVDDPCMINNEGWHSGVCVEGASPHIYIYTYIYTYDASKQRR